VGIVTGGAATTTEEEGIVIGDRVNTAARIQSVALPGCCYVDDMTRAATAAAIAYEDAGEHELKGKSEPVRLFRATRVVAAVAGARRSGVIEAPFIGREHELRLVKELFHASAERPSARMVLVSGVAGVGKSRLAWEFFKYLDGLAGQVLWQAGRCLSYGEGVSYSALSEMVRARLQIGEDDPSEVAADRLASGLERWIADTADRAFVEARLGQLLGLPAFKALAKEDVFAGWRLFFERLSEHLPVVMLIEDLQWADAGMVDFLDHLLEWSGDHALFLLVLTRPEGADRRELVLSRRSVTTLPLDPLSDELMGELLDELVSGLPKGARGRIVARAGGIPLYAIETVRGLLDKRVLERAAEGTLRLVDELGELEIPPGLTALISARLDALDADERRLVKECAVLGESFPRQAVEAVSDLDSGSLGELLGALVRKEVLTVRADKYSPDRGHYAFTQSLIRSVAYDMLTRVERKARHLKTAQHLRAFMPDEGAEVAEVIASHLHEAYTAAAEDADAGDLRAQACRGYAVAAERAESVGAPEAAEAAYLRAVELSSDEGEQAHLIESAGRMAVAAGWHERAVGHFESAITAHAKTERIVEAARVTCRYGVSLNALGQGERAITYIAEALASLEGTTAPPEVVAELQNSLGETLVFAGRIDEATAPIEEALTLAQHHELAELLASALNSKAMVLQVLGRVSEARLLYEGAIAAAQHSGVARIELSAESRLADLCMTRDLEGAEAHGRAALGLARRWGLRGFEADAASNLMYILTMSGRLAEAMQLGTELCPADGDERPRTDGIRFRLTCLEALRGNAATARGHLAFCEAWGVSDSVQDRALHAAAEAAVLLAGGDARHALGAARRCIDELGFYVAHEAVRLAFPLALDAAISLGDLDEADRLARLVALHPRGDVPPFLWAQVARADALVASARDDDGGVEEGLLAAETAFRQLGYPYWTARAVHDRAEWLGRHGRLEESACLGGEAADIFETMGVPAIPSRSLT
jgi:tetratricopeptide (TPR) repeat protein